MKNKSSLINKFKRFLFCSIKPLEHLNKSPIAYKGKNITIVNFGFFAMVECITLLLVFFGFLHLKGIEFTKIIILSPFLGFLLVWFFSKIFKIFDKGFNEFSIYETTFYVQGGIIGGIIWTLILSALTKVNPLIILDCIALSFLVGQFFGRIGCYNYGCCYGKKTTKEIGIRYRNKDSKVLRLYPKLYNVRLHPSQLYDSYLSLIGFLIIISLNPFKFSNGVVFGIVSIYSGFTRMCLEGLRSNNQEKKKKRFTYKFAKFLFLFGILQVIFSIWINSKTISENSPQTYINFLINSPVMIFTIIFIGILTFLGYGVHGNKLGCFPFGRNKND